MNINDSYYKKKQHKILHNSMHSKARNYRGLHIEFGTEEKMISILLCQLMHKNNIKTY